MTTRTVSYGSNNITIHDSSLTLDQIHKSMAEIFPDLKNATPSEANGTITFEVKAGTKGSARTVSYGSNNITIHDSSLTLDQIHKSMAEIFPELKNATPSEADGVITFEVKAGTKGNVCS